ncbi:MULTISPECIES: tetratricopeptide repeat protein [unclassified Aeromicrobium]|uniref:tetratricopeptide repeat protein n=1 Tax=unclassified Aeromicrobium TaxID=2633570 RepID=UPI00396B33A2
MAQDRNPRNTNRSNSGSGPRKPASSRSGKPTSGKPSSRDGKPSGSRDGKPSGSRDGKPGTRSGGPQQRSGGQRPGGQRSGGPRSGGRPSAPERTAEQKIYDGPPIPDDVSAKDLDKHARQELSGLPDKLADKVARHLVMAGTLLHSDPETAHKHALAARARAMRVGLVREATGETAYALGNWAEALAEFRAARRMTGRHIYAPMMADAERALGRPEKALEYDNPDTRAHLDEPGNTELSIVIAGARRDLGHLDTALHILETEPLHTKNRADWVTRLRYAYADTLLATGNTQDAITWFHRAAGTDTHHTTDAHERLQQLED